MWWRFKKLKEIKEIDENKYHLLEFSKASKEDKKKYRNNKNVKYIARGIPFGIVPDKKINRGDRVILYDNFDDCVRIGKIMTKPFGSMPPVFDGNETLLTHTIIGIEIKEK